MAFKLEVLRGSTTYNISAGQSIALESIDDLGGASVRNLEESGPYQDGTSHLGFRLEPRLMTLRLTVVGSSASVLDGLRDTLNAMFKPVPGVPIILRVTRDDGDIRQIECQRTGPLTIPLRKEERPGNLYRAVVMLRAADPTWYDPTEIEAEFITPTTAWWIAFETIGTANVLEHAEAPSNSQAWTNAGSVAAGSPFTIFARSAQPNTSGSVQYLYSRTYAGGDGSWRVNPFAEPGENDEVQLVDGDRVTGGEDIMAVGVNSYMVLSSGTAIVVERNGTVVMTTGAGTAGAIPGTAQGTAYWRHAGYEGAVSHAAAYNIALNTTQKAALYQAVLSGSAYSNALVYEGDWDSYPVITLVGPFGDPVITNALTGDTLDFTGGTIGGGEVWVIDTRYGRKSVLQGTVSVVNYLSDDSDLATFRIVPAPLAAGGTNPITIGGSAGTAASLTIAFYNRYLDF